MDPETFAGLYAGYANPEVAQHLNLQHTKGPDGEVILRIDAVDGRLRYKGTVVRLYAPSRLRELFDRRETFRIEEERKRRTAFAEYVNRRRHIIGDEGQPRDRSEVEEMATRYRQLQPILADLSAALEAEVGATSLLQGSSFHYFSLSIGGINVPSDMASTYSVDPETLGAIYAQRISAEYADSFEYRNDGRVLYEGNEIQLYSVPRLQECFGLRDRLLLQVR